MPVTEEQIGRIEIAVGAAIREVLCPPEPARPEARYHKGDSFRQGGNPAVWWVVQGEPTPGARFWEYPLLHSDDTLHTCDLEGWVDCGAVSPCPPRPDVPEDSDWKAPVECREFDPEKDAGWFARGAGTGEVCTQIPEEPIKRLDWGLRVWIAVRKAPRMVALPIDVGTVTVDADKVRVAGGLIMQGTHHTKVEWKRPDGLGNLDVHIPLGFAEVRRLLGKEE